VQTVNGTQHSIVTKRSIGVTDQSYFLLISAFEKMGQRALDFIYKRTVRVRLRLELTVHRLTSSFLVYDRSVQKNLVHQLSLTARFFDIIKQTGKMCVLNVCCARTSYCVHEMIRHATY